MRRYLTFADITGKIVSETYTRLPSGKVLVCELILENGYSVTGQSAVVDAGRYNEEIGREISYDNAVSKIWQLEGYLLQEKLSKEST
jgi:hypothetical protein